MKSALKTKIGPDDISSKSIFRHTIRYKYESYDNDSIHRYRSDIPILPYLIYRLSNESLTSLPLKAKLQNGGGKELVYSYIFASKFVIIMKIESFF